MTLAMVISVLQVLAGVKAVVDAVDVYGPRVRRWWRSR